MRLYILSAVVVSVVLTVPVAARAEPPAHAFGLGIELGAPTGVAAKYYLGASSGRGGMVAVQGGLGAIRQWGPDGFHLHVDVVWHPAVLVNDPAFTIPFYVGVGGRILDWSGNYCFYDNGNRYCEGDGDTDIGLRVPVGLLMDFHNVPLDVFVELAMVLDFIHVGNDTYYNHDILSINGVLGVRYYF